MGAYGARKMDREPRKSAKGEVTKLVNELIENAQYCDQDLIESFQVRLDVLLAIATRMEWEDVKEKIIRWGCSKHTRRGIY